MIASKSPAPDASTADGEISYRIAGTRKEREAAFRLVYQAYVQTGLSSSNARLMRVTEYQLLETTDIFVASFRGRIVSTVSLVADAALGLPMESVYPDEVRQWRRRGLFSGEVTCLAQGLGELEERLKVYVGLCRLMVQTARRRGMDQIVVAVHPRHARFYERYMDFQRIGRETVYPSVCERPAVALYLNFARVDRERPRNYSRFFGEPIRDVELRPRRMPPEEREYFRGILGPHTGAVTAALNEAGDGSVEQPAWPCPSATMSLL